MLPDDGVSGTDTELDTAVVEINGGQVTASAGRQRRRRQLPQPPVRNRADATTTN
jgi:hypothetical protein